MQSELREELDIRKRVSEAILKHKSRIHKPENWSSLSYTVMTSGLLHTSSSFMADVGAGPGFRALTTPSSLSYDLACGLAPSSAGLPSGEHQTSVSAPSSPFSFWRIYSTPSLWSLCLSFMAFFVFEGTALLHLLPLVRHIKITPHSYVFTVLYRYLNFKQVYDVIDTLFHIFGKSTPNIDYVFERWAIFLQITSKYLYLTPEPIGRF